MRVLAVCKEDPANILGGMGRHVRELYRAMATIGGVEIDILTTTSRDGKQIVDYNGATKWHADNLIAWKNWQPGIVSLYQEDFQCMRTVLEMLAAGSRWDVVHCHEWNSWQIAKAIADKFQLPLVATMHLCMTKLFMDGIDDDFEGPSEFDHYMLQMEGHLIAQPDELILCSKAYGQLVNDYFHCERPYHVIYNGIRMKDWDPIKGVPERAKEEHDLPERPIALFVGRIAEQKGSNEILDAIENFGDNGYCIVLAGEVNANTEEDREGWSVTKRIRRLCSEYPNRLRWIGFQQDQALLDLYALSSVGLMPSNHEPFGIVALEMMSMQVPLIASAVDGLGEVVTDGNGGRYAEIIKPCGESICRALIRLKDSILTNQLITKGLARAKEFDWLTVSQETVEVYRKSIKEYRHG